MPPRGGGLGRTKLPEATATLRLGLYLAGRGKACEEAAASSTAWQIVADGRCLAAATETAEGTRRRGEAQGEAAVGRGRPLPKRLP